MRPNRSTAAFTAALASARLVTSSLTGNKSFDCPRAFDTRAVSRPVATTAYPTARAALAKSAPMPRLAPVMNQTFLLLTTSPSSLGARLETLDAVRDLGSVVPLVRELRHRQGERLQVSGDSQRSSIHGFKANVTNQRRRDVFGGPVIAAVHEARPAPLASAVTEKGP